MREGGREKGDVLLAWQAWRTLRARRMSPLLRRTRLSTASGSILTSSSWITWSTSTLMSLSFSGLNLNRVHRERRAGLSLWV